MSSLPRYDLSSHYAPCSVAMKKSLKKIIEQNYSNYGKIQPGVLSDAQELFRYAINVINGEPATPRENTALLMVLDHLGKINPQKDSKNDIQLRRDVRSLASLLDNLKRLEIPEDQREYVPLLQKFFELLSITGEETKSEHNATGQYKGRYSLELGP